MPRMSREDTQKLMKKQAEGMSYEAMVGAFTWAEISPWGYMTGDEYLAIHRELDRQYDEAHPARGLDADRLIMIQSFGAVA